MICPYCEVEVTESAVEAEDGYCPECGVFLSASSVFNENDDFDDDELEEYEDDDDVDNFGYDDDFDDDNDDEEDY
jgi:Zn-finger nucleic acid-binding protein